MRPDEEYFAYADYFPPGHNSFFIQSSLRKQYVSFKNLEVLQRISIVKKNFKRVKKTKINRDFSLKQSVFSMWAVSLEDEYKKAFESDMKYSKIKKFIKDGETF